MVKATALATAENWCSLGGQVAAPGKVWENTLHPDGALHTMGHSAASQIIFNLLTLQLFYFIEFSL